MNTNQMTWLTELCWGWSGSTDPWCSSWFIRNWKSINASVIQLRSIREPSDVGQRCPTLVYFEVWRSIHRFLGGIGPDGWKMMAWFTLMMSIIFDCHCTISSNFQMFLCCSSSLQHFRLIQFLSILLPSSWTSTQSSTAGSLTLSQPIRWRSTGCLRTPSYCRRRFTSPDLQRTSHLVWSIWWRRSRVCWPAQWSCWWQMEKSSSPGRPAFLCRSTVSIFVSAHKCCFEGLKVLQPSKEPWTLRGQSNTCSCFIYFT